MEIFVPHSLHKTTEDAVGARPEAVMLVWSSGVVLVMMEDQEGTEIN